MKLTPDKIQQIVRDYFELTGVDFLRKYTIVEEAAYWDGEEGEGLMQALIAQLEKLSDVCPDCKNIDPMFHRTHISGKWLPCPKCKGTGRNDEKLREDRLANYLWNLSKKGLPQVHDQHSLYLEPFRQFAQEILSLIKES